MKTNIKPAGCTYLLTDAAKLITWGEWKRLGGCSLSQYAEIWASRIVGTFQVRNAQPVTLGQLQDACIVAGREIARFAKDHLDKSEWARVEYSNLPSLREVL